jgi:hypothetical protein
LEDLFHFMISKWATAFHGISGLEVKDGSRDGRGERNIRLKELNATFC